MRQHLVLVCAASILMLDAALSEIDQSTEIAELESVKHVVFTGSSPTQKR